MAKNRIPYYDRMILDKFQNWKKSDKSDKTI